MESIILLIKGFFIGIANIIPGVSGGTIALIMGLYEKIISTISHFLKDVKGSLKFALPLGIGMILSMVVMSGVISYSFENYPLATTLFFDGLVLGGVPFVYKKINQKKQVSNWVVFLFTFAIVIAMAILGNLNLSGKMVSFESLNLIGYIKLFIVGMIGSATMVIPGVSGSLILMLIGYYYPVLELIKALCHFENLLYNGFTMLVFGLGLIMGIVVVSKLIEKLFKAYENKSYYGIFGFVTASILAIPIATFGKITYTLNIIELLIGLVLLGIGYFIARKLGEK